MKRLIFIVGSTETLEYFSFQVAEYFLAAGREVFLWDMRHPVSSINAFEALEDPENSILITFNFIGLCGEGQFGEGLGNIWDANGIEKICIMVDSPVYYYRQLSSNMENLKLFCIDRYHQEFVERYYPFYGKAGFLPLAGNKPLCSFFAKPGILKPGDITWFEIGGKEENFEEWNSRSIDVLFTGNYVPPESLEPSISHLGPEYKAFVKDVAREVTERYSEPFERVITERLTGEFPESSEDELLQALYGMVYVDLYVRNIYRGKIVTALADRGLKVYCTGKDWDKAPCKHPENIIHTGDSVVSLQCLEAMSRTRISLNMMPWFKAGAHDRVFSSMLSGCVCLSDSSEYLDEVIGGRGVFCEYKLTDPESSAALAADLAAGLLADPEGAYGIAFAGKKLASEDHTWKERAKFLELFTNNS